jgi:RNA-binding protein
MYDFPLTGAQKSKLRSLGQTLDAQLKVGRGGLRAHELVKIRFVDADRDERPALCEKIADEGRCVFVSAVGHTALFYRQNPNEKERVVVI